MTPGQLKIKSYYGDTLGVSVTLKDKDTGQPFDMSLLGDLSVKIFPALGEESPFFEPHLSIDNNLVSFLITADMTKSLRGTNSFLQLRSLYLDLPRTLINATLEVLDARSGRGVSDVVVDAFIDLGNLAVDLQVGDAAAIAVEAKEFAKEFRDQSHMEANRSKSEADRSHQEANRSRDEADRSISEGAQKVSLATVQADRSESEANRATSQVSLAVIEANRSTSEANRSTIEADKAASERAKVENAADAFVMANQAITIQSLNRFIQ
jgi:hypothetical protein